jgi:threonine dehydrogenase-like Zn-dependent dehydrogenase
LITHRIEFERIAEAYRLLDTQSEPCLQVLIHYPPED